MKLTLKIFLILIFISSCFYAQSLEEVKKQISGNDESLQHRLDRLEKLVDDVLWFQRVGDIAFIDKIFMTGPPLAKEKNPAGQGSGNPIKFWSYVFIPKGIDYNNKYPLIVLPHGGVHADFTTYYTHIIRELMYQQYIVVAAEYRGSTGYGEGFYGL